MGAKRKPTKAEESKAKKPRKDSGKKEVKAPAKATPAKAAPAKKGTKTSAKPSKPAKKESGKEKKSSKSTKKSSTTKPRKTFKRKVQKKPTKKTRKEKKGIKSSKKKPSKDKKAKSSDALKKKSTHKVAKRKDKVRRERGSSAKSLWHLGKKAHPVVKKARWGHPKPWFSIFFRRPKTRRYPKQPMYPRHSTPRQKSNYFSVIKYPLTTESAMQKIEEHNTLVFIVDLRSNKRKIKHAVRKMYDIKAAKVNTLITPDGRKKAYVKLVPEHDALDIANKIGIL